MPDPVQQSQLQVRPMTGNMAQLGFACRHAHCQHDETARFWGDDTVVIDGDLSQLVCKDCADAMVAGCPGCFAEATDV